MLRLDFLWGQQFLELKTAVCLIERSEASVKFQNFPALGFRSNSQVLRHYLIGVVYLVFFWRQLL